MPTNRIGMTNTRYWHSGNGILYVQYMETKVVIVSKKYIYLNTGGWFTNTTKVRMNQTSSQYNLGYHVYARAGQWYVINIDGIETPFRGNRVKIKRPTSSEKEN